MPEPSSLFLSAHAHHSADPFRLLVESVVDYAIYMVDRAGVIASWNPGAERIYGYRADEIIGKAFTTVFAPHDLENGRPEELWQRSIQEGHHEFECMRSRKDQSQFWAIITVSALRDHFGNHAGFSVVTRDISERKQAEDAIRRERDLSKAILASLPGIYYMYDENRRFLRWNHHLEIISGYSAEEIARLDPLELFDPAERQRVAERIKTVFTEGHSEVEADLITKDGRRIPYYFNGIRTVMEGQSCLLGMGLDIAAQHQAREELSRTTNLLRAVIEGTPDALFVKDLSGKYLLFNPAAARFTGKPTAEVIGQDDTTIFDFDSARIAMEHDQRVITSNQADSEIEELTASGMTRSYIATKMPFRDAEGNVVGVLGISRDITDQKRAEDTLRQQQALLRIAGRITHMGGWTVDLLTNSIVWSDEICEIHEEPLGHQPSLDEGIRYYVPEYRERVIHTVQECAANGTAFDFEAELITAKGRRIWVRSIGEPVRNSAGQIVGLQGAFQNVSDRKQAEDERQRLGERLAKTLESINEGFFTVDREWRFTFVNTEAQRMIRRGREELIGITIWEAFPETIGIAFERNYRIAVTEDRTVDFEEFYAPLGMWFGVRAHPTQDGLAVYFRDVTAARNAENAIRISEERFRLLSKATNDAIWDWDLATDNLWWNEGFETLFGYHRDEVDPTSESWINSIHPDDKVAVVTDVQKAIDGVAQSWAGEYRFMHKNGSVAYVMDRGYITRDANGKATRMIGGMTDLTKQRRAEESLRLRDWAIQKVSQGILITDSRQHDNPVIYASPAMERITGYDCEEILGRNFRMLQGRDTDPDAIRKLQEAVTNGQSCSVEQINYKKNGTPFWNELSINPVTDSHGAVSYFVGVLSDITERKHLETQLRQSQKMEAVGRLAGGVAHDFNNLLTIISGYSELLLTTPDLSDSIRASIMEISEAGQRAAALTRQLLGFSRQSMLQPKVLDLNAVITETGKLIRRLIGEDIHFAMVLAPQLSRVKVDPSQLDQILINLAVNARDAMPRGGKLTIETSNVSLSDDYAATHLDCKAGQHVMLAMTDTGHGMTPEVMARIFEPFYTTKEVGKGTGLGLAMVFGIVQQSGGCVHVYSEPDRGTTFKIYLPAVAEQPFVMRSAESRAGLRGTETILLVEDDEAVRGLAVLSLKNQGYQVLTATDGNEALRVAKSHPARLDLILTDVVMPSLSGPEMVKLLKADFPTLKVLFMSGYTDDAVVRHGLIEAEVAFIQKPYTPLGLARKVRQILDEK